MEKQLTLVLHLCFLLFLLPKSFQSESNEDRKVYVVYMGHNTLDDASASSLHMNMLLEVIGRDAENHMLLVHMKIGILMWDDDEARDKIAEQSVEKRRKREKSRLGSRSCTRPV